MKTLTKAQMKTLQRASEFLEALSSREEFDELYEGLLDEGARPCEVMEGIEKIITAHAAIESDQ